MIFVGGGGMEYWNQIHVWRKSPIQGLLSYIISHAGEHGIVSTSWCAVHASCMHCNLQLMEFQFETQRFSFFIASHCALLHFTQPDNSKNIWDGLCKKMLSFTLLSQFFSRCEQCWFAPKVSITLLWCSLMWKTATLRRTEWSWALVYDNLVKQHGQWRYIFTCTDSFGLAFFVHKRIKRAHKK